MFAVWNSKNIKNYPFSSSCARSLSSLICVVVNSLVLGDGESLICGVDSLKNNNQAKL